ncbi:MAG TPA: SemiSWEET transporter [Burkholderiales bacterium]|nr:SemiSWEET transporter [Burkholderiales bacterium]
MSVADLLGSIAGVLTTVAFVPQVWAVWKTRSTRDISLGMYLVFTTGVSFWLAYGVALGAWPIIVANAVTLALTGTVLVMKLRHG